MFFGLVVAGIDPLLLERPVSIPTPDASIPERLPLLYQQHSTSTRVIYRTGSWTKYVKVSIYRDEEAFLGPPRIDVCSKGICVLSVVGRYLQMNPQSC